MTPKQKAAIKHNIKLKWQAGEITQAEYDALVQQLEAMAAGGATLQEANQALGMYKKAAKPAAGNPSVPMTKEEMKALKDELKKQYMSGILTLDEWDKKVFAVTEAFKAGKTLADAKKDAASASSAVPAGMTHEEYIGLWQALKKKMKAGLITHDEYIALGTKLDQAYKDKKTASEIEKEIGCDPGTLATDEAIIKLGKEFKKIYGQAAQEMQTKLDDFLKKAVPEMDDLNQKLLDGTITPEEFDHLKLLTLQKKILGQKVDQLTGVMTNANQKAMAAVNGEMLGVFADNAAWQSYQITQDAKMDLMFSIYDEHTAENLIRNNPKLLPPRKGVDGQKDQAWNRKMLAGTVAQAVIQGESIPKLARRIAADLSEKNSKAMMRYARTAMTGAQNAGRIEMLHQAEGMGIKVKKRWLATLDSRTRDSHQHMDGVSIGVDEEFKTPLGSKMQYPGDVNGKGGDVWNCRCTLVYDYEGFPNDPAADVRRDNEDSQVIASMPYDEWKAAKKASVLNGLSMAKTDLANAQKEYISQKVNESKVYENIWKDPVTLADYPAKAASIQAKRDYYTAEIDKYKQAINDGYSWATTDKLKELQKKLRLLNEFEKHGQILQKRNEALKKVQDLYGQAGIAKAAAAPEVAKKAVKKAKKPADPSAANPAVPQTPAKKGQFAPDAWDEKTKKAARSYRSRYDADKVLRPELDKDWDQLTDHEKYAVWEYTRNSNPMNKSLSGYHESWSRSNYIGYANTEWGHEDRYRSIGISGMNQFAKADGHVDYKRAITDLTLAIEKTPMKKDTWLVRGSDEYGFAGMMEGGGMNFNQVASLFDGRHSIEQIRKALVGQVGRNHAFTSTGIASDAGFDGNIKYRIYAPEGTKCIYAEPQSYYGMTSDKKIYKKGQAYSGVGSEAEVIVQRGTAFRITNVIQQGRTFHVEMEIVDQPNYFTNGDEDTFNGGKTRHKR